LVVLYENGGGLHYEELRVVRQSLPSGEASSARFWSREVTKTTDRRGRINQVGDYFTMFYESLEIIQRGQAKARKG
jgi:hypothetical protein